MPTRAGRPRVGADEALALLLGGAPTRSPKRRGGADKAARPYVQRATRCEVCGHRSPYNYSFDHDHTDGLHRCGPFCTACASDHIEREDVPRAPRPLHRLRDKPDDPDPFPYC